jgi:hypothetical protein
MRLVKVANEGWFKQAEWADVKAVAIRHLNIPADVLVDETKRTLVRQKYKQDGHKYGEEFDVADKAVNPFGIAKRRSVNMSAHKAMVGTYRFIKNSLRAPEGDIRHQMMATIERCTSFEELFKEWEKEGHTLNEKYRKGEGKKTYFVFREFVEWSIKREWIEVEERQGERRAAN